jgi:hypothetical protein
MWQRKQTIFLALTSLCMVLMIFFPVWVAADGNLIRMLYPLHYTIRGSEADTTIYYPYASCAILAIAAATVAIIEIGKFENRLLQLKLGALNSVLMAGALGTAVYFATRLIKSNQLAGGYDLGLYLPAIAMVSNMIANRFIRKDEKLVRDSERIR